MSTIKLVFKNGDHLVLPYHDRRWIQIQQCMLPRYSRSWESTSHSSGDMRIRLDPFRRPVVLLERESAEENHGAVIVDFNEVQIAGVVE